MSSNPMLLLFHKQQPCRIIHCGYELIKLALQHPNECIAMAALPAVHQKCQKTKLAHAASMEVEGGIPMEETICRGSFEGQCLEDLFY